MSRFWSDLTNSDAFTLGLVLGAAALVVGILVAGLVRRGAPVVRLVAVIGSDTALE